MHDDVQEDISGTTTSRTAPDLLEIAEDSTSLDGFDREDDGYISGYKLFAALFGIISVFFLVLLDFSIISTVSTESLQDHCVTKVLYHYD